MPRSLRASRKTRPPPVRTGRSSDAAVGEAGSPAPQDPSRRDESVRCLRGWLSSRVPQRATRSCGTSCLWHVNSPALSPHRRSRSLEQVAALGLVKASIASNPSEDSRSRRLPFRRSWVNSSATCATRMVGSAAQGRPGVGRARRRHASDLHGDLGVRPRPPRSPNAPASRSSRSSKPCRPRPPAMPSPSIKRAMPAQNQTLAASTSPSTRPVRRRGRRRRSRGLMRVLPERARLVLHLRFNEDLTQSRIAQMIGVSQMHVRASFAAHSSNCAQRQATLAPPTRHKRADAVFHDVHADWTSCAMRAAHSGPSTRRARRGSECVRALGEATSAPMALVSFCHDGGRVGACRQCSWRQALSMPSFVSCSLASNVCPNRSRRCSSPVIFVSSLRIAKRSRSMSLATERSAGSRTAGSTAVVIAGSPCSIGVTLAAGTSAAYATASLGKRTRVNCRS